MEAKTAGLAGAIGGLAGGAALGAISAIGGKVLEFGQQSVEAASNLEQSMGAVDAVFGDAQGTIKAFGDTAAQSVGLSESAFQSGAANIGALLQNMGSSADEAAASAIDLTKVGADFAAQYGGTTTDALDAVQSALKGQFDPLEKYAVSLSAAQVNAKAVELGLISEGEQLDAAAKAQATLALITEQGASAQGAFARESDTLAGKQQRATAAMEDAKAQIGTALMPVMVLLADVIGKYLAPLLEDLAPLVKIVADVFGAVLAPVLEIVGEAIGIIVNILDGRLGRRLGRRHRRRQRLRETVQGDNQRRTHGLERPRLADRLGRSRLGTGDRRAGHTYQRRIPRRQTIGVGRDRPFPDPGYGRRIGPRSRRTSR